MNENMNQDGPKPWPRGVRYVVVSILVVVAGVGLVTFLYSKGIIPLAGPFVAMIVGPVIVTLAAWWRSRRKG